MTADVKAPPLPQNAAALLRSVDIGEVLGATRQLQVLGEALVDVARVRAEDAESLAADVNALVAHVTRTRGASSQAVVNGLERMAGPFRRAQGVGIANQTHGALLVESVETFRQDLDGWLVSARQHGRELLQAHRSILAYDYSSTVAQVVADVTRSGHNLTVFVPEARSLDGGRKYLTDWQDLEATVHLIPDAALGWALGQCDAAVAGAETLSADGGCYNTIGTAMVAHEAIRIGVPFYVLSVLLKTDLRTLSGDRPSPSLDFLKRLKASVAPGSALTVRGSFPDLDYTNPEDIAGVVTEGGVVRPGQLWELASAAFAPGNQR